MFRIHGDPETNRYNPVGPLPDLAAAKETLRGWLRQWDADGYSYWAVRQAYDSEIIGFDGIRRMPMEGREDCDILNLYYRFTPAAWAIATSPRGARDRVSCPRVSANPTRCRPRAHSECRLDQDRPARRVSPPPGPRYR